ncbi:ran exchange factor prp20 [Xylaria flabelliformis]|nr:ran exchange factor prp20 [Xylaria flabelliformis]
MPSTLHRANTILAPSITMTTDSAILLSPTKIHNLCQKGVVVLDGGAHHSAAVTANGQYLPRICLRPTTVPDIGQVAYVAYGMDHTIFIDKTGSAHSTGFGFQGQLGLASNDDVVVAQRLTAKSVKDRILTRDGAGGNVSLIAGPTRNN